MKSEDPTSQNTQDMSRIYKKLDEDRNKQNLEYAILVSELKQTVNETQVIRRVMGYKKMYIVRPEYFLLLLDIITAFGYKYKEIVIESEKEKLEFEETEKIISDF